MSNAQNRREYYRIFTEVACRFGKEAKMYQRQVNISAGGVAFTVMPEAVDHFSDGDILPFAFELNRHHFEFNALVVRHSSRNFQTLAALKFQDVDEMKRKTLDNMILSLGGYRRNDLDKKREYLAWYAPELLHAHPNKTAQHDDHKTTEAKSSPADIDELNDLYKEFNI